MDKHTNDNPKRGKKVVRATAKPHGGLGTARYDIIQKAAQQVASAHSSGFCVESLMLLESILSDRIQSRLDHLRGGPLQARPALGQMLKEWEKLENVSDFADLIPRVDAWAKTRNEAAHGMAKLPDLDGPTWDERYATASVATLIGAKILLEFGEIDARERKAAQVRPPATAPDALHPLQSLVATKKRRSRRG